MKVRTGSGLAVAAALLLSGCAGGLDEPAITSASYQAWPSETTSAPAPAAGPDLTATPEEVATKLTTPWGLAFLPDGSALVGQRDDGRIYQVRPGGARPRLIYRVPGVVQQGDGGLLGLAVAADFASTGLVYAYCTSADDDRIVRFKLGDQADAQVIFSGIDTSAAGNAGTDQAATHGGRIAFGPDGMLYAGTGDAGTGSAAQDPDDADGKILRLTPDGRPAPGNPRANSPVWTLGHRNVQGLAWDAGGTMYATEFGPGSDDEVNVIRAGRNYGWPAVAGKAGKAAFAGPMVRWAPGETSPSGAAVAGRTLYVAALSGERLWDVPLDGGAPKAELSGRYGRLRTVAVAPDGSLWLTTSNTDGSGTPKAGDDRVLRFGAR